MGDLAFRGGGEGVAEERGLGFDVLEGEGGVGFEEGETLGD